MATQRGGFRPQFPIGKLKSPTAFVPQPAPTDSAPVRPAANVAAVNKFNRNKTFPQAAVTAASDTSAATGTPATSVPVSNKVTFNKSSPAVQVSSVPAPAPPQDTPRQKLAQTTAAASAAEAATTSKVNLGKFQQQPATNNATTPLRAVIAPKLNATPAQESALAPTPAPVRAPVAAPAKPAVATNLASPVGAAVAGPTTRAPAPTTLNSPPVTVTNKPKPAEATLRATPQTTESLASAPTAQLVSPQAAVSAAVSTTKEVEAKLKSPPDVVLDPSSVLTFRGSFKDGIETRLRITNKSADSRVCFKVKTNVPPHYSVHPSIDLIEPLQDFDVTVYLQATSGGRPDADGQHKFMVQSIYVPDGSIASLDKLWQQARPNEITSAKLVCAFEQVDQTPLRATSRHSFNNGVDAYQPRDENRPVVSPKPSKDNASSSSSSSSVVCVLALAVVAVIVAIVLFQLKQ